MENSERWEYQTTLPASWETCMQVRKQQLELDMEQKTGSKEEKPYVNAAYCHPAYLTYMQSTSCKTLGWMKHKLESRLPGEISMTADMQMTPPFGRKWRRIKKPLDESERGELKVGLKLNIQKTKIMASGSIASLQIDGKTMETVTGFIFLGSKLTADDDCSHEIKRWKKSYDQPRQHIKKQRHYFANKGPCSQSYGFSSGHVWMWDLDYKESWVLKNWCFWTVVLEKALESPLDYKEIHQSILREISPGCSLEGLMLKSKLQYFGHLMGRTDSLE